MRNRCPPGWRPPVQMRLDEGRFRRHVFVKAVGPASSAARRSRRKDPASRRGVTTQIQARFGPGASQDLPRRPPGLEMNWAVAREPTVWPSSWAASPRYTTRGDCAVTRTGPRRAIIRSKRPPPFPMPRAEVPTTALTAGKPPSCPRRQAPPDLDSTTEARRPSQNGRPARHGEALFRPSTQLRSPFGIARAL